MAGVPNLRAVDWTAQQEVGGGQASEASSAAPHRSHYCLNHPPTPIHRSTVFHETGPWCQKRLGTTGLWYMSHVSIKKKPN